jgi:hypothetical protein
MQKADIDEMLAAWSKRDDEFVELLDKARCGMAFIGLEAEEYDRIYKDWALLKRIITYFQCCCNSSRLIV